MFIENQQWLPLLLYRLVTTWENCRGFAAEILISLSLSPMIICCSCLLLGACFMFAFTYYYYWKFWNKSFRYELLLLLLCTMNVNARLHNTHIDTHTHTHRQTHITHLIERSRSKPANRQPKPNWLAGNNSLSAARKSHGSTAAETFQHLLATLFMTNGVRWHFRSFCVNFVMIKRMKIKRTWNEKKKKKFSFFLIKKEQRFF